MKRSKRVRKWPLLVAAVVLAAMAALAAAFYVVPGVSRPELGESDLILRPGEGGGMELRWSDVRADACRIYRYDDGAEQFVFLGEYPGGWALLSDITLDHPVKLKLQGVSRGKNLLGISREMTSDERLVTVLPQALPQPVLEEQTAGEGVLSLGWTAEPGLSYQVFLQGEHTSLAESDSGAVQLRFGEGEPLGLPAYGQPHVLLLRAACQGEGYVLYSRDSAPILVNRESLLTTKLHLEVQETGERSYTLRWNETQGDYYELQTWSRQGGNWETLAQVEQGGDMSYDTGKLNSGAIRRYRVTARHSEVGESVSPSDPTLAAVPSEVSVQADISTQYCTVWPLSAQELFADEAGTNSIGRIPGGTALCVLEEVGDFFYVRFGEEYGYVDSRTCLIDLPAYLGDYCAYSVTNSYSSVFRVHQYPIAGITGRVVKGYENIRQEDETTLVPYLYPSAKKLLTAAKAALADGYRLKIYDAFRPNEATRFLYDTATTLLDQPVPALDEEGRAIDPKTGYSVDLLTGYLLEPDTGRLLDPVTGLCVDPVTGILTDPVTGEIVDPASLLPTKEPETPEMPKEPDEPVLPVEGGGEESEPVLPPDEFLPEEAIPEEQPVEELPAEEQSQEETPPQEPVVTYLTAMTDNRFRLGSFLAASVSAHNQGIALDLTMEDLATGEELPMQSAIHDLSWHSILALNNDNAKLLAEYMTGAGLKELSSEWWHFQDNETREAVKLSGYLVTGLNAGGWTKDDTGWRYRSPEGVCYRNTTVTIGKKQYAFDNEGYVIGE